MREFRFHVDELAFGFVVEPRKGHLWRFCVYDQTLHPQRKTPEELTKITRNRSLQTICGLSRTVVATLVSVVMTDRVKWTGLVMPWRWWLTRPL